MAKAEAREIGTEMGYRTEYVTVKGARMAYVAAGEGEPILFLHGTPTSKYLWRNVLPWLEGLGRVIAPDLIGMGESDKPALTYRFHDHYAYLCGFIEALGLDKMTLVVHDWGSGLGFKFAAEHAERIKGIAFMEALVKPMVWSDFPVQFRLGFRLMRMPVIGWLMVSVGNVFVKQILPAAIVRPLRDEEKAVYARPYPTIESRKAVRMWPCEIPINGKPADMQAVVAEYSRWLQETDVPKLFFYATPGAIINEKDVAWVEANLSNLTSYHMGEGVHFVQEDNPHFIGEKLAEWYEGLG
ncbi:MAG TPA: haloalkane dehalogenase [Anaerolineae bacterium]|nr:haloalkane dehalogenase [Anaerolineae bacterium]